MSETLQQVYVGRELYNSGVVINVYDTYEHALAHAATGLNTRTKVLTELTGAAGAAVTQTAKVVGFNIDQNGFIHMFVDDRDTEVFIIGTGQFGPPRRVQNAV